MAYIAPIHLPSSARLAIRINLLSGEEENLVLAKANRLEIWRILEGAMSMVHSTSVNGTISMIQKLRPKDSPTDLLFVGTDRFQYFTSKWNAQTGQLEEQEILHDIGYGERLMRESQSQDRCLVDPTGKFMAMHLWEGVLNVMRLRTRGNHILKLDLMDQVRLSELFIKASTFLYTETGLPKIAFLYHTNMDKCDSNIAIYQLTENDRNNTSGRFDRLRDREFTLPLEDNISLLIPVRKVEEEIKRHNVRNPDPQRVQLGGLLLVGEYSLTYIDAETKAKIVCKLKEADIFVAWAEYDPTHYFLADDYGMMHLLTIMMTEGDIVDKMIVHKMGPTSRASCLEYLGDDLLFVGSHYGDSQLFRVDVKTEKGEFLHLVQKFPNIAPIMDFTVMDMGNRDSENQLGNEYSSGQARIVTGSGVHKDGSLRSVRSGVGLEDVGILGDFEGCRGLFSLTSENTKKVDILVASFLTETRIFRFDSDGEIEELASLAGFSLDAPTLLATNLPGGRVLQVTPTAASLFDAESDVIVSSWNAPDGKSITNASASNKWLLLAVDGTAIVSFELNQELQVQEQKDVSETDQVSCVHVAADLDNVGVVGFWMSGTVSIIHLSTLDPIHGQSLRKSDDSVSVPGDLALIQILPSNLSGPTLFIAMQDGNVVTYNVGKDLSLSGKKSVVLGAEQARFHLLPKLEGGHSIFATSEHPSLIYGSEGRIVYSAVTAEDATYICAFDASAFPDSIVLATNSEIKISQIDKERRTHVRSLAMGKTIRRIAYSPKQKVFGLGCIKRDLVRGEELVQSSFELVDEIIFEKVGKPFLFETASHIELVESAIRAELLDAYGATVERFIVGTSYSSKDGTVLHGATGRILVFGMDSERNLYLVASKELKGACRCLAVMGTKIVAGLTKTVVISQYNEVSSTQAEIIKLASYRPSTYPVDLAVEGNMIAVADVMKSITLVEYVAGNADEEKPQTPKLEERARHYESAWATAVVHIEGESWLEADAQGNLLVLRRNLTGGTEEDRKRLQATSTFNIGEQTNRMRKISVEANPNALITPKAFLGTVEGGIYMFGTVAPHAQDLLMRFQTSLAKHIKTLGEIDFKNYRSFRGVNPDHDAGDGPYRFLDGDLLERFLDVDEKMQEEICQGLGPSVEDMRNMVEELKRMH